MGHRFALARRALSLPSSTSTPSPARLAPAVVDLAAGFESFLVTTPWATTFSRAPEVQLILASFPLIVMGFVGVAFAVLELSSGRMNRARLDLFIALAAAFLAGLLSLLNVLRTEAIRLPLMSIPLRLGEAIALSTFVLFRTYYLFRTCFQIGRRPLLSTNKDLGRDEKSVAKLELVNEILRWKSYALLAAIFALQLVWRIGFVTSLTTFRSVYTISQIVELVFLAFLVGKSIVLVRSTEIATKRALASIAPTLIGIVMLASITASNLFEFLFLFSETPLGRFIALVTLYILILDSVIRDNRHRTPSPRRRHGIESSEKSQRNIKSDSFAGTSPPLPQKTPLRIDTSLWNARSPKLVSSPEEDERSKSGIIVRRSSRIPSWLHRSRGTESRGGDDEVEKEERKSLTQVRVKPTLDIEFEDYTRDWGDLDSPIDAKGPMLLFPEAKETKEAYRPSLGEGSEIHFSSGVNSRPTLPIPPLPISPLLPPMPIKSAQHSREDSNATYRPRSNSEATLFSSPPRSRTITGSAPMERESTMTREAVMERLPSRGPNTASSQHESFMDPCLGYTSTPPRPSTSSDSSSEKKLRQRESISTSRAQSDSFSLSNFPTPYPRLDDVLVASRPGTITAPAHRSTESRLTKVVTEDGLDLEFELFPQRTPVSIDSAYTDDTIGSGEDAGLSRYNVTSMFEAVGLDSSRSSMRAEIHHATYHRSLTPSSLRNISRSHTPLHIPSTPPPPTPLPLPASKLSPTIRLPPIPPRKDSTSLPHVSFEPTRAYEKPRPAPLAFFQDSSPSRTGLLVVPPHLGRSVGEGGRKNVVSWKD